MISGVISLRRVAFGLWVALIPLLAVMLLWPVNSRSLRFGILLAIFAIIAGSIAMAWKRRALLIPLFCICFLVGLFLLLPGRPLGNISELNALYVEELSAYEGVPYVWGGETHFGMDCSGLVRKGFQNVLLRKGLVTWNPFLVRGAFDIWWNDTTAEEIGRGYDDLTLQVTSCRSINALDPAKLQPGDLAVTTSGTHVMAYLGGSKWIGADPGEMKVTIFSVPEPKNGWFSCPMNIVRWNKIKG